MKCRHAMLLFYVSLPVCIILRTIQIAFTIDSATGFIKQQYFSISNLITVVICAAIAAVGMLSAATDEMQKSQDGLNPALAIGGVVASGMFVFQTVASISLLKMGAWYDAALTVLSFLSVFVFLAYGLKNIYEYKFPSMILIVPVVFYIVKLISIFVSTSSLALVTENILLIFTNSVLLWFMFEFASFENEIGDTSKKPKRLFASGIAAIMLCAVTSLPKFVLMIFNYLQTTREDIAAMLLNVAVGTFIFIYIVYGLKGEYKKGKAESKHSA